MPTSLPAPYLATSEQEILDSLRRFNARGPTNRDLAKRCIQTTTYWIQDASTGRFGPSKFCGFAHMTFSRYVAPHTAGITASNFDGYRTRRTVSQVTSGTYSADAGLAVELQAWAAQLLGEDVLGGHDLRKKRFVVIGQPYVVRGLHDLVLVRGWSRGTATGMSGWPTSFHATEQCHHVINARARTAGDPKGPETWLTVWQVLQRGWRPCSHCAAEAPQTLPHLGRAWLLVHKDAKQDLRTRLLDEQLPRIAWGVPGDTGLHQGDKVFIHDLYARGKKPDGVIAAGRILSEPCDVQVLIGEEIFGEQGTTHAVWLHLDEVARKKNEIIKTDWIENDPVCGGVVRARLTQNLVPMGTRQRVRLEHVWERAGENWSEEECLGALWAYHLQFAGMGGMPIFCAVAVHIGRAVIGVIRKSSHFANLDPRNPSSGRGQGGAAAKRIWMRFFDEEEQSVRVDELELAYLATWGEPPQLGAPVTTNEQPDQDEPDEVPRTTVSYDRIARNTAVVRAVKLAHDFTCQVCGVRLVRQNGPYAEGAHIRPLGGGHRGPDREENVLCLCPNHHALFDGGAFAVEDDGTLVDVLGCGVSGQLRGPQPGVSHVVEAQYLRYHREVIAVFDGAD